MDYSEITRSIKYIETDLDNIYFKYYQFLNGVCYTYVRDINNTYEGFPLVSDSWGNESYNLYNEFDIIDEFFSNSHEVEVAYDQNLNLANKYNNLDGVILREGTRVLLTAQTNVNELGVYVVQYDNTLIKTDEMNTYDNLFRYKAHVGAGTYADQEIHVWPILPPTADPFLSVISPLTFDYESGQTEFTIVTSNRSWTLYKAIPWISVSTSGGAGDQTITLKTTMTNNTFSQRTGIVNFIGEDNLMATLVINQTQDTNVALRILTNLDIRETTDGFDREVLI